MRPEAEAGGTEGRGGVGWGIRSLTPMPASSRPVTESWMRARHAVGRSASRVYGFGASIPRDVWYGLEIVWTARASMGWAYLIPDHGQKLPVLVVCLRGHSVSCRARASRSGLLFFSFFRLQAVRSGREGWFEVGWNRMEVCAAISFQSDAVWLQV